MSSLSVGELAIRLGVAPSTVRMWGRRYGLDASERSPGGHRRYTADDVARLRTMAAAVVAGASPADAALSVLGGRPATPVARRDGTRGGPGGAVLAVPGAGAGARGLARAASRLDAPAVEDTVLAALRVRGTEATWDELLRPVLFAAGSHWERTGTGIEVEHLLTQAVTSAFVRFVARLPSTPPDRPVLLAGGPREEHVLPLHATRAALAERGVPSRMLGPRTPSAALTTVTRRTGAPAVFVWLTRPDRRAAQALTELHAAHRRLTLLAGGPGWQGRTVAGALLASSLPEAVTELGETWLERTS